MGAKSTSPVRRGSFQGTRMKAKREHRVPLSPAAVDVLHALPREDGNTNLVSSVQTPAKVLGGHGTGAATQAHGPRRHHGAWLSRSAFSDWAHEQTAHANHTIELSSRAQRRLRGREGVPTRADVGQARAGHGRLGQVLHHAPGGAGRC